METIRKPILFFAAFVYCLVFTSFTLYAAQKPSITAQGYYNHDKCNTPPKDIIKEFSALVTSFGSFDDNVGNGKCDILCVPEWIAYEIKRYNGDCIHTKKRPKQFVDPKLVSNAIPRRDKFNMSIWLDLEYLTAAWAQRYGSVVVITGPIFNDGMPKELIETGKGKLLVAVPDILFKIVVKVRENSKTPDVLAFIYPLEDGGYKKKPYNLLQYLRSVDDVEVLTGLDFLTKLPDEVENSVEEVTASRLWEVDDDDFVMACR